MNAWSYGYNEPRQIYRSVYMDGLLLTVSDRLLRIDDLQSKATQVSSNVSVLSLLALLRALLYIYSRRTPKQSHAGELQRFSTQFTCFTTCFTRTKVRVLTAEKQALLNISLPDCTLTKPLLQH